MEKIEIEHWDDLNAFTKEVSTDDPAAIFFSMYVHKNTPVTSEIMRNDDGDILRGSPSMAKEEIAYYKPFRMAYDENRNCITYAAKFDKHLFSDSKTPPANMKLRAESEAID